MGKNIIHLSETEAARDFAGVIARARAGAEIVIDGRPIIIIAQKHESEPRRSLSESIALAEAHAKELGYEPTMDPDFAADLEEIIKSRKPREISSWE